MPVDLLLFLAAGVIGGVVNAAAGGAKLFVFPLLLATGLPPLVANATGTVAMWPAQIPAAWVYRKHLFQGGIRMFWRIVPALAGGLAGGLSLVFSTEAAFLAVIPVLLFIAVGAIIAGNRLALIAQRLFAGGRIVTATAVILFMAGFYGGYFGAGLGFMLIAAITLSGVADMQRANAEKNLLAVCINSTAVVPLMLSGLVDWVAAGGVLAGGLVGGYLGAEIAQRVPRPVLRYGVAGLGLVLTVSFLLR